MNYVRDMVISSEFFYISSYTRLLNIVGSHCPVHSYDTYVSRGINAIKNYIL